MEEEGKAKVEEIPIICGAERGIFDLKRFGPGGRSRCVRIETVNGSHYLTPIEFEALGGKQHDWKRNLRVAETNKIVREGILAAGLVKPCPKGCTCENCVLAKQQPINLEKLIDTVYSPTASPQKSSNNSSPVKPGEENSEEVSEELPPTPPDSARSRGQSESPGAPPVDQVCNLSPPMDEFYTSPDISPEKKSQEPPKEVGLGAQELQNRKTGNKALPDLVPLFEVASSAFEQGLLDKGKVEDLADEMVPGAKDTPEPKEKKQKDIRSFFDSPTASPKAKLTSPSPEVMVVDTPKRTISVIDLTQAKKSPKLRQKLATKRKPKENTSDETNSTKKRRHKSVEAGSEPSKVPDVTDEISGGDEVASETEVEKKKSPKVKRSARGVRMPDRVEVVKEAHTLSRKSSLTMTEINLMLEDDGKTRKVVQPEKEAKESKEEKHSNTNKKADVKTKIEMKEEKKNSDIKRKSRRQAESASEQAEKKNKDEAISSRTLRVREVKEDVKEAAKKAATGSREDKKSITSSPNKKLIDDTLKREVEGDTKNKKTETNVVNKLQNKNESVKRIEINSEPKKVEKPTERKSSPKKEVNNIVYDKAIKIKQEKGEESKASPVKPAATVPESPSSPSKLPTYATMIKAALGEMNVVGGEGCTKLEILLYILRKFHPKGNISVITKKMVTVLEQGTKYGDFLSSVSLPRKIAKKDKAVVKTDQKKVEDKKKGEDKPDVKNKVKGKKLVVKGKPVKIKKEGKPGKKEKKETPVQSPHKLREPLSTICKAKKLTRYEVLKKIWIYIRVKKLQDPKDKSLIICDDNFRKLTKLKQIKSNSVVGYLKPFMDKL